MAGVDGNHARVLFATVQRAIRPPAMAGVDGNVLMALADWADDKIRPPAMAGVDGNRLSMPPRRAASAIRPPAMAGVDGNLRWKAFRAGLWGFARQQWRAWIETISCRAMCSERHRFARQQWRAWIETTRSMRSDSPHVDSPASNGGRGLKRRGLGPSPPGALIRPPAMAGVDGNGCRLKKASMDGKIRPPAMAGVDGNSDPRQSAGSSTDSPASNGGRGLKRFAPPSLRLVPGFARQQWRAWIETARAGWSKTPPWVRPPAMAGVDGNSQYWYQTQLAQVRPPAMAGVDGNFEIVEVAEG